jgi:FixJ family two-component response regulator
MTKAAPARAEDPVVFVIDDDPSMREALRSLFQSVGWRVELFASAPEFMQGTRPDGPACLVLDIRLPRLSGLEFQTELAEANIELPIIFITGHGISDVSEAMKAGAVAFCQAFPRPGAARCVARAIERDKRRDEPRAVSTAWTLRVADPRERSDVVTAGLMNKQVARDGVTELRFRHRGHVMRKMAARSLADQMRIARSLGIRRT